MDFTLKDLKAKVEETRKQLEEEEAAVRVLERMIGGTPKAQPTKAKSSLSSSGKINLDELDIPVKTPKKSTLVDDMNSVIDRFENQEFTINHVEAALKQLGKGSNAKHFKNRISVIIRKLLDAGALVRTHKGVGSDPHKYKQASKTDDSKATPLFGSDREQKA